MTRGTVSGICSGDTVTVTATGTFANASPGQNKSVTVSYALSGTDAGNYTAPANETKTANIKEAPSMVVTTANDTVDAYDGVISLRETLTTTANGGYFGTGGVKTVTFASGLTTIKVDSEFALNANHSGLVINGDNRIVFSGQNFSVFHSYANADYTFTGLTFQEQHNCNFGGALWCDNDYMQFNPPRGTITFNYCNFVNMAGSTAAAIHFTGTNGVLNNCYAKWNAGSAVINNWYGNLTVNNSTFENNVTHVISSSIDSNNNLTLSISGSTFSNNSGGSYGGAIYADMSTVNITDCTIKKNTSTYGGGAVYVENRVSTVTVSGTTFEENTAGGQGGAICFVSYSPGSALTVTTSNFSANKANGGNGGAISLAGIGPTIRRTTFTGNSSSGSGGAIYTSYGETHTYESCEFTTNKASSSGGAIFSESPNPANITMTNTIVKGNHADSIGCVYAAASGTKTLTQCLIVDNTAKSTTAGIYTSTACTLDVSWSTLANNVAGGVAYNDVLIGASNSTYRVTNSIIYNSVTVSNVSVSKTHCIENVAPASLFVAPSSGNYHLKAGSSAINASGVTSGTPTTDLDGNTRAGHGSSYDCGAYEYLSSSAQLPYSDIADAAFASLDEDDFEVDFDVF